mmetsp:Transcript_17842/g.24481  ORF Transcript_17842/g.24481 Transcript_17842/m.24481 type:complete len:213 (+) Transcript_17842:307-945(+)
MAALHYIIGCGLTAHHRPQQDLHEPQEVLGRHALRPLAAIELCEHCRSQLPVQVLVRVRVRVLPGTTPTRIPLSLKTLSMAIQQHHTGLLIHHHLSRLHLVLQGSSRLVPNRDSVGGVPASPHHQSSLIEQAADGGRRGEQGALRGGEHGQDGVGSGDGRVDRRGQRRDGIRDSADRGGHSVGGGCQSVGDSFLRGCSIGRGRDCVDSVYRG